MYYMYLKLKLKLTALLLMSQIIERSISSGPAGPRPEQIAILLLFVFHRCICTLG